MCLRPFEGRSVRHKELACCGHLLCEDCVRALRWHGLDDEDRRTCPQCRGSIPASVQEELHAAVSFGFLFREATPAQEEPDPTQVPQRRTQGSNTEAVVTVERASQCPEVERAAAEAGPLVWDTTALFCHALTLHQRGLQHSDLAAEAHLGAIQALHCVRKPPP